MINSGNLPQNGANRVFLGGAALSWRLKSEIRQDCFLGASMIVWEGVMDSNMLETYACKEGLVLGEDLLLSKVTIASD